MPMSFKSYYSIYSVPLHTAAMLIRSNRNYFNIIWLVTEMSCMVHNKNSYKTFTGKSTWHNV